MLKCSQTKCRIAETGVCLEGHKQGCPHLLPDNPDDTDPWADKDAPPAQRPHRFHTGEKLTASEASRILSDRPARVVLCVGAQWSGKTTLLARLGEMFRDGSFEEFRFAGSSTLCAFERATWRATITSGAVRPDTPRTERRENDTFLHLRVHQKDEPRCEIDLLISDLAGETFPTAVASLEFCAEQCALARADHLVLFLDCFCLVNSAKRHSECDNARTFLQRVIAVRHEPAALHVHVVFSRWDYVDRHEHRLKQEKFCEELKSDLTRRFGNSFASLGFRHIAARPTNGATPTNGEIQLLFARWLEAPLYTPPSAIGRNRNAARDFSAFGLK